MNNTLRNILAAVVVLVIAGALLFGGYAYGRFNTSNYGPFWMMGIHNWNNRGGSYGYGPGMMGRSGMMNGYGPGMMGARPGTGGYGYGYGNNPNASPLTVEETKQAAENYIRNLGISDLSIAEVMIFDNNGYVVVKENAAGVGAFELLVDPASRIAYPEYGPNMMWNLKYGGVNHNNMMGGRGMMGWNWSNGTPADISADMPVTGEQAIAKTQEYLDQYIPGATAATDPIKFYGYYTLDFEKDGKVAGMLSVNGYSGQVFLHTWHGTFIEEAE